jgi:hypothetical protein
MSGNKNPSHKFPKNNDFGNKNGSPAKTRITKSKLRKLADKLREREDIALAIVDRSLAEQEVANDVVSTAKWVLNSIVTIEKAASAEEISNFNARMKGRESDEEEQTPEEIAAEAPKRLSLVYQAPDDED